MIGGGCGKTLSASSFFLLPLQSHKSPPESCHSTNTPSHRLYADTKCFISHGPSSSTSFRRCTTIGQQPCVLALSAGDRFRSLQTFSSKSINPGDCSLPISVLKANGFRSAGLNLLLMHLAFLPLALHPHRLMKLSRSRING